MPQWRRRTAHGELIFDVGHGGEADGEPVVLLHGFPQDSSCWDGVTPGLHAAGYRTVALDQRGYSPGARPAAVSAYRLVELVGDVVALIDSIGGRAHVVGHDWGAAVAWGVAAGHPDRVTGLTALSVPHPRAMQRAVAAGPQALRSWYMGAFQIPRLPEALLTMRDGAATRTLLARMGLPPRPAGRYAARLTEPGAASAALAWYRALRLGPGTAVDRVRVPTLHLWGRHDPTLGATGTYATSREVRAPYRLVVLEDAGHWLPETHADQVLAALLEHLAAARTGP